MGTNPINKFRAIVFFMFGAVLTWFFGTKISLFLDMFTSTFPKAIIIIAFASISLLWTVIIPYITLTNENIGFTQIKNSVIAFAVGLVVLMIGLPVSGAILDVLPISGLSLAACWFLISIVILFFSVARPYLVVTEASK